MWGITYLLKSEIHFLLGHEPMDNTFHTRMLSVLWRFNFLDRIWEVWFWVWRTNITEAVEFLLNRMWFRNHLKYFPFFINCPKTFHGTPFQKVTHLTVFWSAILMVNVCACETVLILDKAKKILLVLLHISTLRHQQHHYSNFASPYIAKECSCWSMFGTHCRICCGRQKNLRL